MRATTTEVWLLKATAGLKLLTREELFMNKALIPNSAARAVGFSFFYILSSFPSSSMAQAIAYPDLKVLTPPSLISIGNPTPSTRELRFSHVTWDAGAGPLEIRPTYNPATGQSWAVQRLYTRTGSGGLSFVMDVPIAIPLFWVPPSDYRFPMSGFGLYSDVNGSIGTLLAASPKVNFCMTADTEVGGVSHTPTSSAYPEVDCTDPNGILGLSVGWGDQYDYTDPGENIDITSLPDDVYWLRSIADPYHLLQDSNPANNVTDTQVRITGNTVTVLQQLNPDSTPPNVTVTFPTAGSSVSGAVTLSATATAAGPSYPPVESVQFLVDGLPVSGPVTSSTSAYSTVWNSTSGPHVVTAQATASLSGFIATAQGVSVSVPTQVGTIILDQTVSANGAGSGTTATTPVFSVGVNEVLVAFVAADGPVTSQSQTVTVSGGGLNWQLVSRSNMMPGDAEIWAASVPSAATNLTVTSTEASANYNQSLTITAFHGLNGATVSIGAHANADALNGAPSVSLTTTGAGSWVFGVGSDYDTATARRLGPNQEFLNQQLFTAAGVTFWVQATSSVTPLSNTLVTLNDTAPTSDRWDFSAVEVLASGTPPPPPTPTPTPTATPTPAPPVVTFLTPSAGSTLSGSVTVSASASSSIGLASANPVLFFYNGTNQLPGTVTATPPTFSILWDTTRISNGAYTLSALATDSNNNKTTATVANLTITNPPPTNTCFVVDRTVAVHGRGPLTTAPFSDALTGELLVAFAGSDGPDSGGSQTLSVSGGGLAWKLVKRANAQAGTAEVWAAFAPSNSPLTNATVTATQSRGGYDMSLYVIAVQGTNGIGTSVTASASRGAPSLTIKTTAAGSLLYGVGEDWDRAAARTLGPNQILDDQWLDTTGDSYWVQNQTYPPLIQLGTSVMLNDTAPTNDRWNFVGIEILAEIND
jgi:hypothetical protein